MPTTEICEPVTANSQHQYWFEDKELVGQFPWLYRQYARYCRAMVRPSGIIRGGTVLFNLVARLHVRTRGHAACRVLYAGKSIYLDLSDNRIFEVLEEVGTHSEERRAINALMKPGDTFVDIGANHGGYSLIASEVVGKSGLVVAFEPQPHLATLVEQSLSATALSDFRVFAQGCGSQAKTVEFFVPDKASGSAGLFREFSAAGAHKAMKVELTTIDDCFSTNVEVRGSLFLKLDVEGSEYDALLGARNTIARYHPPILFEVNPSSAAAAGHSIEDLLELLDSLGYHQVCETTEFPRQMPIRQAETSKQRNLLALHG